MTIKKEKFSQLVVKYGDKSKALRESHDCSKMSDKTINEKACRLATEDKVSTRIEEIKEEAKKEHGVDRAFIINGLQEIINDADYTFNLGRKEGISIEDKQAFFRIMQQTKNTDKLRALESLAKMLGLNEPEQIDHTHTLKTYKTNWSK